GLVSIGAVDIDVVAVPKLQRAEPAVEPTGLRRRKRTARSGEVERIIGPAHDRNVDRLDAAAGCRVAILGGGQASRQRGDQGQECEITPHRRFLPLRGAGHSLNPGLAGAAVAAAAPLMAGAGAAGAAAEPETPI